MLKIEKQTEDEIIVRDVLGFHDRPSIACGAIGIVFCVVYMLLIMKEGVGIVTLDKLLVDALLLVPLSVCLLYCVWPLSQCYVIRAEKKTRQIHVYRRRGFSRQEFLFSFSEIKRFYAAQRVLKWPWNRFRVSSSYSLLILEKRDYQKKCVSAPIFDSDTDSRVVKDLNIFVSAPG